MSLDQLNLTILIASLVLLLAVLAVRVSARTGMPSLLLYLGLGMLLGEGAYGLQFEDFRLTTALGSAALAMILIEGGLTTDWQAVRPAMLPASLLATLGTVVSVSVVAAAAALFLHLPLVSALLVGALVSSTDAAAVFSVLRRVPLPHRLTGMLEAESGLNDAPVVILVVALAEMISGQSTHPAWQLPFLAALELITGAVLGIGIAWLGAMVLSRLALPSSGLYPIAVVAQCCLAYGVAAHLHASGFIAAYLSALVLGNAQLPHQAATRGFAEGLGWLAQIGLFVMLGLLVSPGELRGNVTAALVIGLVLLFVARPLSVAVSVPWFGYRWRDVAFLSWAGLRGAVPVVLATIPVAQGGAGAEGLFELVFILVVVFTLVQAPTLPWVAHRLGLTVEDPVDLDIESSPLEAMRARVMQLTVGPTSKLHGVSILELRLPKDAQISLIVRDKQAIVPSEETQLRRGDALLLVASDEARESAERRLRAVSRSGRLAAWSPDQRYD